MLELRSKAPPQSVLLILGAWFVARLAYAQDLTPRAYVITPLGSNAVTLTYSFFDGAVFADPTIPITDFKARYHAQALSYYHAFSFAGRSANVVGSLPYALGNFRATVAGVDSHVYRSGLADMRLRFSVNLRGARAMPVKEFVEWHERTTLGASLTVVAPTGQYDPARALNPGSHRLAVKPELGFSRSRRGWTVDRDGGVWFFAPNSRFFPGDSSRSQAPVGSGEVHLVRYLTRRFWLSGDANFWAGGRTTVNGNRNTDYQKNSRFGVTVAIPLDRHQSLKFGYSRGAYISIGGDYQNISMGWQYSWIHGLQ